VSVLRVLITGSKGFIGKNLVLRLQELKIYKIIEFTRNESIDLLPALVSGVDVVIHLAGENRPKDEQDFIRVNTNLTRSICDAIQASGRLIPLLLASSTQAEQDHPYGRSKLTAEELVEELVLKTESPAIIYRLPGVFGKWCRPNYNSVVATFCHNIANDLPVQITDASARIHLNYVEDVVNEFIAALRCIQQGIRRGEVLPRYSITLGELADQISAFRNCRASLVSERVGVGLTRALYTTYMSYLPTEKFAYDLPRYDDERGVFVEMLKTKDSGQVSYFTTHPGITRGGHYHHTKTEKFLVIKGNARFRFRHLVTNEMYEIWTAGDSPKIVDTIPGWAHDITNVGDKEMVVILWANEVFDRELPDTIACEV
jgi:UDP-2-acetamido-2,6-beta-L-arabino-hexul-4-ose reductase